MLEKKTPQLSSRFTYRKELQEHSILAIAKLEFEDSVGSHLCNCRQSSGLEIFAKPSHKGRWSGGSRSGKVGQVAAKSIFYQQLLLVIWLGEFEEQNLGGQVVDVCES